MKGHKNLQDSGNITYPDLLVIQEPTCNVPPTMHFIHLIA